MYAVRARVRAVVVLRFVSDSFMSDTGHEGAPSTTENGAQLSAGAGSLVSDNSGCVGQVSPTFATVAAVSLVQQSVSRFQGQPRGSLLTLTHC